MPEKPRARIASLLLDRPVGEFLDERRARGDSWKSILRELLDATDGEIDTTEVTVRTWHREYLAARARQGSAA